MMCFLGRFFLLPHLRLEDRLLLWTYDELSLGYAVDSVLRTLFFRIIIAAAAQQRAWRWLSCLNRDHYRGCLSRDAWKGDEG
jgi:hypothetical protein